MIRTALLILSGNATASLLLLARNLLVARLIPVGDYGVAATFAIVMAVVEMMSALGLQQQIIQSKNGDIPNFQASLQGFQVLRGLIAGLALMMGAGVIADFLNIPDAAWAYRVMAAVPILNALVHFDIYRLNRRMVVWPMIWTGVVPAFASLLAIWPLALWFRDWQVLLWAIMVQVVLTMLVSHLVAERPYRLIWDRVTMGVSLRFGWPILMDGGLLFLVFNGDKLIVGRLLGMEALAVVAMGTTLTLTPTLVMAKTVQNTFLPQLSATAHANDDASARRHSQLTNAAIETALLCGGILVFTVVLLGPWIVNTLLGPKYIALSTILSLFAVMQAVRVFKSGSGVVALARGRSGNSLIANLPRVLSLPLAWATLSAGGDLKTLVWIGIGGEVTGFVVSLLLIRLRLGIFLKPMVPCLLATGVLLGVAVSEEIFSPGYGWVFSAAAALAFGLQISTMTALRGYIGSIIARKREG